MDTSPSKGRDSHAKAETFGDSTRHGQTHTAQEGAETPAHTHTHRRDNLGKADRQTIRETDWRQAERDREERERRRD